jgi:histidine decarboxylase
MAQQTQQMAAYAERSLHAIGWQAWRAHRHACTVVLDTPPRSVLDRWPLATLGNVSHLVCTPAVTRERISRFVAELRAAATPGVRTQPKESYALVRDVIASNGARALVPTAVAADDAPRGILP